MEMAKELFTSRTEGIWNNSKYKQIVNDLINQFNQNYYKKNRERVINFHYNKSYNSDLTLKKTTNIKEKKKLNCIIEKGNYKKK